MGSTPVWLTLQIFPQNLLTASWLSLLWNRCENSPFVP